MTNADQKAAIRKRMAETGENYTTARRKVTEEAARRRAQQTADADAGKAPGERAMEPDR